MPRLEWDKNEERQFEMGVSKMVLFPKKTDGSGTYDKGVAWNGVTGVTESPSGADVTDLWADNIKYASLRAAETYGSTIEAYMYPDEFAECDGSSAPAEGVYIGQQTRRPFGFAYCTNIGVGEDSESGYKLNIVYNATASPSDNMTYTVNCSVAMDSGLTAEASITFDTLFETRSFYPLYGRVPKRRVLR